MIDSKLIDDITSKLAKLMPADLGVLKNDFENNARATLQGIFEKLDLVTREEFDVQADLLARTQEKIRSLEEQIKALEEKQGEVLASE